MKTRITRLTLTKDSISDSDCFDLSINDEGGGEYLVVSWGVDGNSISIGPSEWPFLRDAVDRMFEEIAENEGEGKQAEPDAEAPPREQSSPIGAASGEAGWIPWNGGECPVGGNVELVVRFRDGRKPAGDCASGWDWSHLNKPDDIIAYKVVD